MEKISSILKQEKQRIHAKLSIILLKLEENYGGNPTAHLFLLVFGVLSLVPVLGYFGFVVGTAILSSVVALLMVISFALSGIFILVGCIFCNLLLAGLVTVAALMTFSLHSSVANGMETLQIHLQRFNTFFLVSPIDTIGAKNNTKNKNIIADERFTVDLALTREE